jgi:hypothetical protein
LSVVEDLECGDRPEDFLLDDRCAEVLDFDQAGPAEGAGGAVRDFITGCRPTVWCATRWTELTVLQ